MKRILFSMILVIAGSLAIGSEPTKVDLLHLPSDSRPTLFTVFTGQAEIILSLDSVDFAGNCFISISDCAIARALKRQLHVFECLVGSDNALIYATSPGCTPINYTFDGREFGPAEFDRDQELSRTIRYHIQYVHLKRI
jgi:hypothetical protein